ncbi:unnamed protein product [Polarella glacialis]|uniref:ATP-dependent DNA helicase n=1 Tax=Polarella glacialis TaxID=89957 RepID=A0A813HPA1_POLGL|nr:unnamed protein product [Polarella glacialis]CAE8703633.1 unnamed protein product [Polarella glacialis]
MCPEYALGHLQELAAMRQAVCLLAVDEAHCISHWGQDFRPQYRELGRLREALGWVPTMCVTATCTEEVRADIMRCLHLRPGLVQVVGPMNRPNLRYAVRERSTMEADLGELFASAAAAKRRALPVDNTAVGTTSSAIVYTATKARSEEVASWLFERGVLAAAYHAGLSMAVRYEAHRAFLMDELQVVVATVAFGMGIDKPSIRRVVHYGGVRSLEHYVQQSGRAGRDGDDAECVVFSRAGDIQEARNLILHDFSKSAGLQMHCQRMLELHSELIDFLAEKAQCRRIRLLRHFGELPTEWPENSSEAPGHCVKVGDQPPSCGFCDTCLLRGVAPKTSCGTSSGDFTRERQILLRCVDACGGFTGAAMPCAVAAGHIDAKQKRLERHPAFGSGSHRALSWWKAFLPHLRQAGWLQERASKLMSGRAYVAVLLSETGRQLLAAGAGASRQFLLEPVPKNLEVAQVVIRSSGQQAPVVPVADTHYAEQELYRRLSHVRQQWMRRHGVIGESIVSNAVLKRLAEVRPPTVEAALQVVEGLPSCLGTDLAELFEALVAELRSLCQQRGLSLGAQASLAVPLRGPGVQVGSKRPWSAMGAPDDHPEVRRALPPAVHRGPCSVWTAPRGLAAATPPPQPSPWLTIRSPSAASETPTADLQRFAFVERRDADRFLDTSITVISV